MPPRPSRPVRRRRSRCLVGRSTGRGAPRGRRAGAPSRRPVACGRPRRGGPARPVRTCCDSCRPLLGPTGGRAPPRTTHGAVGPPGAPAPRRGVEPGCPHSCGSDLVDAAPTLRPSNDDVRPVDRPGLRDLRLAHSSSTSPSAKSRSRSVGTGDRSASRRYVSRGPRPGTGTKPRAGDPRPRPSRIT